MEVIRNNKGGEKLCYNGYIYTKKSASKTTKRWECSRRSALNCNGIITTNLEVSAIISSKDHNHELDEGSVEAAKMHTTLYQQAKSTRGNTSRIVADSLESMTQEGRLAMGNLNTVKRYVQRKRQEGRPKDPESLRDLEISGEWTMTRGENPVPFLLNDNGAESSNRIIIFATKDAMHHLAKADVWYMDGTFSSAPALFEQLFVIRAPLGDSAISCVYGFLSGKSQEIYQEFLTTILEKGEELGLDMNPVTTMSDFEKSLLNAIENVLGPHIHTKTCFYHLTQNTWRKVQSLGLSNVYKQDESTRHFCGMIDGLAFLPADKIIDGINFLKLNCPTHLEPLLEYFDSVYVTGTKRRSRQIPPLYSPEKWSVYEATVNGEDRTNNLCETWNNSFKYLVGYSHPTILTAIEALNKDAVLVKTSLEKNAIGEPLRKKQKRETVKLQSRLQRLCLDFSYGTKDIEAFLNGVAKKYKNI
ncbi:uncharacterized protein [Palaemon carinicauda]|uniref:uncharacterized protein n=1 Tax=Palaemon carinicauda TaxID=392227 RepID=UPI0035B623FD